MSKFPAVKIVENVQNQGILYFKIYLIWRKAILLINYVFLSVITPYNSVIHNMILIYDLNEIKKNEIVFIV